MNSVDVENVSGLTIGTKDCQFVKQHIFLSGSIAVGKTTLMKELHSFFMNRDEFLFIREYIDYDTDGIKYLERLQRGLMTNYQFQMYVLKCYEDQLNCLEFEGAEIIIWERHPYEALSIFCKNDQTLSVNERLKIELRLDVLCEKYKIPKFGDKNIEYYDFDTAVIKTENIMKFIIGDIVYPMLMGEYDFNVFIFLYCSDLDEQFKRLIDRGRTIEVEVYKHKEDLLMVNNIYFSFYLTRKINLTN
ncbi:hypothetical protein EDI_126100 [Entamoeba dispar SAW760]|uniref:Deoxynucleoside kinase domain-containing protein n=1 Tax=Entamoeba dispar (strain ATCC PRA-260 / SAW760) TaxID=370354 RepID=B0E6C9_ENTDS|nr:uncharacterized protein EDI_126100 [Entamoeba dispar SAW760]EDR29913.1 hypothetical protein EDI_126100 [Entamoeba dispar SAW760]|eukprot:EDR29913.1 hypothetical protein EDI_126100 [Entamoeba dispar SAW760]